MENIIKNCKEKMEQGITSLNHNLVTVRTGAANANLVEGIEVDYYGSLTPINQMGSITVSEGKTLVIKPYDNSILKDIERAINESSLNLPPQNDGQVIRITVPSLTEETRKELCKKVSKYGEEAKIVIRNIRRDFNDVAKNDKNLNEDMQKKCLEKIQKITDDFVSQIDNICKEKEKDIMKI